MYTDPTSIDTINKRLAEQYRVLDGRPIYRIVWSADQLEMRRGKFSDFYGKIFIRERVEVREIKKYWYMTPPRWVLEKLVFTRNHTALKEMCEELVRSQNGTYEPIFGFMANDNKAIPVVSRGVDLILHRLHNPTITRESDDVETERLKELEEMKYFEEVIGEDSPSPLFIFKNSAWVSTNQLKFKKEYREGVSDGCQIDTGT